MALLAVAVAVPPVVATHHGGPPAAPTPRRHHPGPAPVPDTVAVAARRQMMGFAPWWSLDRITPADLTTLTDVTYFGVDANADGSLVRSGPGWDGLHSPAWAALSAAARARGENVSIAVEALQPATADALLGNPAAPQTLAGQLLPLLAATGATGVNLDIEGTDSAHRAAFDTFVAALAGQLRASRPALDLVVDVYAGENDLWDPAALAAAPARLLVMAYDMAGAGANAPGDPLPEVRSDLARLTAVVPPASLLLGLPFYGREWGTVSNARGASPEPAAVVVQGPPPPCPPPPPPGAAPAAAPPATQPSATAPSTTTPSTTAPSTTTTTAPAPGPQDPLPSAADAATALQARGTTYWDPTAQQNWTAWRDGGGRWHEAYFDSPPAVQLRSRLAADLRLAGVAIWTLGMDDPGHTMTAAVQAGLAGAPAAVPDLPSGPGSVHTSTAPPVETVAAPPPACPAPAPNPQPASAPAPTTTATTPARPTTPSSTTSSSSTSSSTTSTSTTTSSTTSTAATTQPAHASVP